MKYSLTISHIVTAEEANEPESRNFKAGETSTSTLEVELEATENFDFANITQEELDKYPELVTHGVKLGDKVTLIIVPEAPEPAFDDAFEALMDRYKERYPKNKVFYVSSDNQVFLETNKQDAIIHQKSIDQEKQIKVVKND